MIGRIFFLMVAGATGGLIAWALTEPGAPKNIFDDAAWSVFQRNFAMAAGSMIGGLVGLTSGLYQGSKRHAINGLVAGAVLGLLVGPVGVNLGSAVYNAVAGPARGVAGVGFVVDAAARSVGWAIFGAFLGCAEGAVGRSFKRAIQGSIGGLIGGAIGGIGFVLASQVMAAMETRCWNSGGRNRRSRGRIDLSRRRNRLDDRACGECRAARMDSAGTGPQRRQRVVAG